MAKYSTPTCEQGLTFTVNTIVPMPIRECDWCGKTYSYTREHSRFDTDACRVAYYRDQQRGSGPWELVCVVCGEPFTATRRDALYDKGACRSKASRHAVDS